MMNMIMKTQPADMFDSRKQPLGGGGKSNMDMENLKKKI
jgi:hypothetical protein